jgi:hypothetical protein
MVFMNVMKYGLRGRDFYVGCTVYSNSEAGILDNILLPKSPVKPHIVDRCRRRKFTLYNTSEFL